MITLNKISIEGYKSIHASGDIELRKLNVLVGANGSGKSNFISFFKLLNYAMTGALQTFIGRSGGARSLLHGGPRKTPQCSASLEFATEAGVNTYHLRLFHAAPDTLIFGEESVSFARRGLPGAPNPRVLGSGHRESALLAPEWSQDRTVKFFKSTLSRFRAYQFHDTSDESHLRSRAAIEDSRFLYADGGNLAAVLRAIREAHPARYQRIVKTVRLAAPFFEDFVLEPAREAERTVMLRWRSRTSDYEFGPHQLSDGTLRFMALTTLLLQPTEWLPAMIVIDEPELGLHPYAVQLLAALMGEASHDAQIVAATQSAALVDEVEPADVLVVDRRDGESQFSRVDPEALREWLTEYTLSEVWLKNVLDGGLPK